jgi:hypothetical protein
MYLVGNIEKIFECTRMHGMENLEIKVQNIQVKYNCLFCKEIKYNFPQKYIDIIRQIIKKMKIQNRMSLRFRNSSIMLYNVYDIEIK